MNLREIQKHFFQSLSPQFDKEEIENFVFLSFEQLMGFSRVDLKLKSEQKISEDLVKKFSSIVEELQTNKPIQYILGETEFYGLKFYVDENVLIPRQETEELVHWIIQEFKVSGLKFKVDAEKISVLDIGTGSGCIAIALKKNIPLADISALDFSAAALQLAQRNAKLNNVEINFIEQDILSFSNYISSEKYDVIVSNPPYIRQSESKLMHKNVLDYEPHLALFVEDNNPLLFYDAIANFAQQFLAKDGNLFFEINESLGNDVAQLLAKKGFQNVEVKKDLNGKDRMIRACKL